MGREGRGDGPVVGTVPRPTPLRPAGRPAWWDGVSHVVTPPAREHVTQPASTSLNPRARHSTREHVTLADVLAGYVTCSAVTRRSRGSHPDHRARHNRRLAGGAPTRGPRRRRLSELPPGAQRFSPSWHLTATNPHEKRIRLVIPVRKVQLSTDCHQSSPIHRTDLGVSFPNGDLC